jgi:hypothetical protein
MSREAKPRNSYETEESERALATLALMRRERMSLTTAVRIQATSRRTVLDYARSGLRRDRHGEYWALPYDHIRRTLNFLTPRGTIPVTVFDSRTATDIAEYMNAVRKYVRTGDTSELERFKDRSFVTAGRVRRFVTDPDVLDELADAGSLSAIESLYYARVAS